MTLQLGEKIRELRRRGGRTQEALADALGITCQAVSRWKAGAAYPDMELIPSIANFFGITIDELFGFHGKRKKQIDSLVNRIRKMNGENNGRDICMDECLRLAREAAAEYPGNEKVLHCLADVLYNSGYVRWGEWHLTDNNGFDVYDVERHRKYVEWQEAIKIYEGLISTMSGESQRLQATRKLITLYSVTGEHDKAIKSAEIYSCLEDCREIVYANASDGKSALNIWETLFLS